MSEVDYSQDFSPQRPEPVIEAKPEEIIEEHNSEESEEKEEIEEIEEDEEDEVEEQEEIQEVEPPKQVVQIQEVQKVNTPEQKIEIKEITDPKPALNKSNQPKEKEQVVNSEEDTEGIIINSPRSIEACRLEGVIPSELEHIPRSMFSEPGLPKEMANLRYEFHENKRQELINLIK